MTITTMPVASRRLRKTSSMAALMKIESSIWTSMWTFEGSVSFSAATAARTSCATFTVFDCAWRTMPMPMPGAPLTRAERVSSSKPHSTMATSERRVSASSCNAPICFGVSAAVSARISNCCEVLRKRPLGELCEAERTSVATSSTVNPRAASETGMTRTRMTRFLSP